MKVTASAGLKVPYEDNPHRYISDTQTVEVEMSSYYLRRLASGELKRVSDELIDASTSDAPVESKMRGKK